MMKGRSWDDWIAEYAESHQNKWNLLTQTVGIPMIVVAVALGLVSVFVVGRWPRALGLFVAGWVLQFIGHAIEGKPPEALRTGGSCRSARAGGGRRLQGEREPSRHRACQISSPCRSETGH
jgi:uncharacterized membrane protein YGL010W